MVQEVLSTSELDYSIGPSCGYRTKNASEKTRGDQGKKGKGAAATPQAVANHVIPKRITYKLVIEHFNYCIPTRMCCTVRDGLGSS